MTFQTHLLSSGQPNAHSRKCVPRHNQSPGLVSLSSVTEKRRLIIRFSVRLLPSFRTSGGLLAEIQRETVSPFAVVAWRVMVFEFFDQLHEVSSKAGSADLTIST